MRSRNDFCRRKTISTTYSEYVFIALFIKHAKRMRRTELSSMDWLSLPYFSTLLYKRREFREEVIERKMCVSIFSTSFV